MHRRAFIGTCSGAVLCPALAAGTAGAAAATPRRYPPARLVDDRDRPIRAAQVPPQQTLIFAYPYAATPAFLLNLARPVPSANGLADGAGRSYQAPGGVGPTRSVVAYSAICAHQLAYPTREISFISFRSKAGGANRHADVIHCCAEHSQYDPAAGARVLAGPAPQPLTAILLEHDPSDDSLTAVGTVGGEVYDAFFRKYAFKLSLDHAGREREPVGDRTAVRPIEQVCRQQIRC